MLKYLKWGVIGFGNASQNFIKNVEIFDDYEKFFKYNNVDIVYIFFANSLHEKLINLALKYNKNILVKKPSCLKFSELNNILPKIKKKNFFFKESILYLSHPLTKIISEFLQNNEIGRVLKIKMSYQFNFAKKKLFFFTRKKKYKLNIFNKNLGGGALYNYAHYPFSVLKVFSSNNEILEVEKLSCDSFIGRTGVDEYVYLKIKFKNQLETTIELSINKNLGSFIQIQGENAHIYVKNPWSPDNFFQVELNSRKRGSTIYNYVENRSMWSFEIESVTNDICKGRSESTTMGGKISDSLLYLKLIDKCRENFF